MKTIVITGSTRGIGYGLSEAFLQRGCQVVISGRKKETVDEAVSSLANHHGMDRILGRACDVTDYAQVQALWDAAAARFGKVDIWINNAGMAHTLTPVWEFEPEQMRQVIETNLLGTFYGSSVALRGMLKQGYGSLYNMEGFGSRGGRTLPGLTLYGTTKAGLAFLDESLAKELEGKGILTGSILPGMVVTDLLLNQRQGSSADWERSKRVFNILADRVETIAPWIAEQVLGNKQHGKRITWLNGMKVMGRFLTAPFTRRKVIDEE